MHEYSIVQAILARVRETARERGATGVTSVTVRVGEAAGVEVELLRTAWEAFRGAGGVGEPRLRVLGSAVRWACRSCDVAIDAGGPLRCARCGYTARLVAGDEILLERVELEMPEVAPGEDPERASSSVGGAHV